MRSARIPSRRFAVAPSFGAPAVRTDSRLRARYHRLARRFRGYRDPDAKKKAIFAIARTLIVIIWSSCPPENPRRRDLIGPPGRLAA